MPTTQMRKPRHKDYITCPRSRGCNCSKRNGKLCWALTIIQSEMSSLPSFNPHNNPLGLRLFPLYRWRDWGSDRREDSDPRPTAHSPGLLDATKHNSAVHLRLCVPARGRRRLSGLWTSSRGAPFPRSRGLPRFQRHRRHWPLASRPRDALGLRHRRAPALRKLGGRRRGRPVMQGSLRGARRYQVGLAAAHPPDLEAWSPGCLATLAGGRSGDAEGLDSDRERLIAAFPRRDRTQIDPSAFAHQFSTNSQSLELRPDTSQYPRRLPIAFWSFAVVSALLPVSLMHWGHVLHLPPPPGPLPTNLDSLGSLLPLHRLPEPSLVTSQ